MAKRKKIAFDRISFGIIDDNSHSRHLIRTILYTFGARIIFEAEDGVKGLEVAETHCPDILIIDLMMPQLDGVELVQLIRNPISCKNAFVPIIILTAHAQRHRVLTARDVGVSEFLCKPVSTKLLFDRIDNIVRQPRQFVKNEHYFGPDKRLDVNGQRFIPKKFRGDEEDADDEYTFLRTPEDLVQRWETFLI